MKTLLFIIIINVLIMNILLSQQSNVKTPISEENNVTAYIQDELFSESQRATLDNSYSNAYPNATLLTTYGNYSSTYRFNCHGYAWYMTESGHDLADPRWIGMYVPTDEDIYMTDGSYVEVESEVFPGKVSYQGESNDHSAITTERGGGSFYIKMVCIPFM